MTDGAARLCELLLQGQGEGAGDPQQAQLAGALRDAFRHLTSRDPHQFWTSGQVCWLGGHAAGAQPASLYVLVAESTC